MSGDGKLDKKAYKFAVEAELKRLFTQLVFLTFMSFLIALMLFFSLFFDILQQGEEAAAEQEADEGDSGESGWWLLSVLGRAALKAHEALQLSKLIFRDKVSSGNCCLHITKSV